jgi:ABC-2 type transport system ATP-binding protein
VPFIELGVGFNPELTGRENVYLNGAMLGFSRKEIDAMYDDIVAFAELERFMDQKLKNYSSGMQVRLAFSMATRSEADILLVDEVLAVGDADFQRKCFEYFRTLKKLSKTVVFVSHDMNAVREYCDRAILIDNSNLIEQGDTDKVATAYSKMFTKDSGPSVTGNRWGNGRVLFKKVALGKTLLTDSDEYITITMHVQTTVDVESLTVGFFVQNASGVSVLGTNNIINKTPIKNMKAKDESILTWRVPNIFSDDTYTITAAIESGADVCDWWDSAAGFKAILDRRTPYITSPPIELEVKERKHE